MHAAIRDLMICQVAPGDWGKIDGKNYYNLGLESEHVYFLKSTAKHEMTSDQWVRAREMEILLLMHWDHMVTMIRTSMKLCSIIWSLHIDGLVQERRNSSALAMELRLSCTNPLISAIHISGSAQEGSDLWSPFNWHDYTFITAWISNYIHYKVRDEIAYPFPKFNNCTVQVWKWDK